MSPDVASALVVDLYALTMVDAYWRAGMAERPATFSLFVRQLPPERGYLVAAGLDDALAWLEQLRFAPEELGALERLALFHAEFLEWLAGLRFSGRVRAAPEGSIVFREEPVLEVDGPVAEAQLAETFLLNQVTLQTTLATKAARCREAARGRAVVDFAFRRTQGIDAGMKLARICGLVGLAGTSNVAGADRYGIPAVGTMAHAFVQAHEDEADAFRTFAAAYGDATVLLVDTYDTGRGVERAIDVAHEMRGRGVNLRGIRLDSGDLADLARRARRRLGDAGLAGVQVFASGGLDEHEIDRLVHAEQPPIDGFGVGSALGVSADAPTLDSVYKLVAFDGRPVRKTSTAKATWPGPKQVWRAEDWSADVLALADEPPPGPGYRPLLEVVMVDGRRIDADRPSLADANRHFEQQFQQLPDGLRRLTDPDRHPLRISAALRRLASQLDAARRSADMGNTTTAQFDDHTALVVVDVQNDFADPGGSLYVDGGDQIIPTVNRLVDAARRAGALVAYRQDWHPAETPHFDTHGGTWPVHCVQGTWGAELHPALDVEGPVVRKGAGGEDGYSGFSARDVDTGQDKPTALDTILRQREIRRVVVVGLAQDVCVKETALDARRLRYDTTVVVDATRPVNRSPGDDQAANDAMARAGVKLG